MFVFIKLSILTLRIYKFINVFFQKKIFFYSLYKIFLAFHIKYSPISKGMFDGSNNCILWGWEKSLNCFSWLNGKHQNLMLQICTLSYTILLLIVFVWLVQLPLCSYLTMQRICPCQYSTGCYKVSLLKVCSIRKTSKFDQIPSVVISMTFL